MYSFLRFPNFKIKAITLSYDDGVKYDEKLIAILNKYGLKCTFNLNSKLFAIDDGDIRLNKEKAISLYKNSGHEIAIHGAEHLSLADVSLDIATADVIDDRRNLEQYFSRIIKGMAYANGSYSDNVVEMLKGCGIKYARTTVSTENFNIPTDWLRLPTTCHHNNPNLMKLADDFLMDKQSDYFWANTPKLFYLWGHSYEFNNNDNWNVIEDFAKKVGNREDVFYATNMEIYDYIKAYDSLEYSVDKTLIKNTSNIDVYLCYFRKNVLVKANSVLKVDL